jgi:uncharacterized protein (TIGR03435 family)
MSELSVLVKATVVLALALTAVRVAHRSPAAVRALLLASAFAALVVLPVVAFMAPQRRIEIPISSAVPTAVFFEDDTALRQPAVSRSPASTEADQPWQFTVPSVPSLLRASWVSGCLLFTIPVVLSLLRLRRLRSRGLPWVAGTALIERMARQDGVRRRIGVFVHEDLAAPMACGLFRPAIGLPLDTQDWDATALRRALAHELEHVRRFDWPVEVICRLTCSLYWFHPLAWVAWRQLCLESERACDDAVLRNSDRTLYAEQLVLLARRLSHDAGAPMLSMAGRSNLATRIAAVLDSTMARGRAPSLHATAILFAAVALAAAIAPLQAVIAPIEAVSRSAAASQRPAPPQATGTGPTDHVVIERAERPASIDVPPPHASERAATPPAAQAPPPQAAAASRTFEVASVRRNTSGEQLMQGPLVYPGGRLVGRNLIVRLLIANAYGVPFNRVTGGPDWINTDRFDIEGQAGPEASQADIRAMLQALLVERFRLASRLEAREMPIFALTPARSDGTLGPALRQSGPECAPITPPRSGPPLPPPPPTSSSPEAGVPLLAPGTVPIRCGRMFFGGFIAARQITMADFATSLAMFAGRPVVDRTNLTGAYDLDLTFAQRPPGAAAEPPPDGPPSIFTALSEQLGLKLEPDRGPVEMLVVDGVEPPTAN